MKQIGTTSTVPLPGRATNKRTYGPRLSFRGVVGGLRWQVCCVRRSTFIFGLIFLSRVALLKLKQKKGAPAIRLESL